MASFIRMLLSLPFYVKSWFRALNGAERNDWEKVISSLRPFEERNLTTDESRLWLGSAYACLERWEEAAAELQLIERDLSNPKSEARRRYNHAYALAKLGRFEEAANVLGFGAKKDWPPEFEPSVRKLSRYLAERNLRGLRVLH